MQRFNIDSSRSILPLSSRGQVWLIRIRPRCRLVEDGSADAGTLADRERGEPRREDPDLTTSLIFSCCGAASASRLQHGRLL
jgi:hypothetical protein